MKECAKNILASFRGRLNKRTAANDTEENFAICIWCTLNNTATLPILIINPACIVQSSFSRKYNLLQCVLTVSKYFHWNKLRRSNKTSCLFLPRRCPSQQLMSQLRECTATAKDFLHQTYISSTSRVRG